MFENTSLSSSSSRKASACCARETAGAWGKGLEGLRVGELVHWVRRSTGNTRLAFKKLHQQPFPLDVPVADGVGWHHCVHLALSRQSALGKISRFDKIDIWKLCTVLVAHSRLGESLNDPNSCVSNARDLMHAQIHALFLNPSDCVNASRTDQMAKLPCSKQGCWSPLLAEPCRLVLEPSAMHSVNRPVLLIDIKHKLSSQCHFMFPGACSMACCTPWGSSAWLSHAKVAHLDLLPEAFGSVFTRAGAGVRGASSFSRSLILFLSWALMCWRNGLGGKA